MVKSISLFCLIIIIVSAIYLNEGCNIIKPVPTPTPIPTFTAIPTATPTQDPKAFLIDPGKGMADLQINKSTLGDVEKLLGNSKSPPVDDQGNIKLFYEKEKITFWFTPDTKILRAIWLQNDSYKTSEGIGIGSNLMDIQNTYKNGVLDKDKKVYYSNDSTDYFYDAGIVTSIFLSDREPVETPTEIPSVPQDYKESAENALEALQALQSATKAGINYNTYLNRKIDTQITVDKFLNKYRTDYIYGLRKNVEGAMKKYNEASELWSEHITSEFSTQALFELRLQQVWESADEYVEKTSKLLDEGASKIPYK